MEQVILFGSKSDSLDTKCVSEIINMGVNGVPVAPHGLILGENEATPSKKFFKHLPDLKTAMHKTKTQQNVTLRGASPVSSSSASNNATRSLLALELSYAYVLLSGLYACLISAPSHSYAHVST